MANQHKGLSVDTSKTPNHRFVISNVAITIEFYKVCGDLVNIIKRVRAVRMPGELNPLPAGQVRKSFLF